MSSVPAVPTRLLTIPVAQCVARAGRTTHVLLDDRIAEHVPGCNMAFRREALLAIDGFNPVYLRAGDDVDVCWRLQAKKQRIGFSPSALVWHHHRPSIKRTGASRSGMVRARRGSRPTTPRSSHTAPCCGTAGSTARCRSSARCRSTASTAASGERRHFRPSTRRHPAQLLPHSPAWQGSTLALVGAAAFTSGYIGLTVVLLLAGVLGWITTIARCLRFGWRSISVALRACTASRAA